MKRNTLTMILIVGLTLSGLAQAKPKILYIDSYHRGYGWSDGVTLGIAETLGHQFNRGKVVHQPDAQAELMVHRMDTKRCTGLSISDNATPEQIEAAKTHYMKKAAAKAKKVIESWQPDLVIVSDDNAAKYLIARHYKNAPLPVVFCGINWDAKVYGFPCDNITGMVEVALIPQLLKAMQDYAQGKRIGFLGSNTNSNHKDVANFKNKFGLMMDTRLVDDFDAWKTAFRELQTQVDMLIVNTTSGIKAFDLHQARAFVAEHSLIPTGTAKEELTTLALLGYVKLPHEQGQWAAMTALKILQGTSPRDIPVVANRKGQIYLNMPLAGKLGIRFPYSLVKQAKIIHPQVAAY